jgi:hypothetical protein
LRGVLDDVYRDTSYALDEDGFAEAEEMDLVRKRFVRAWEGLVDGYRVSVHSVVGSVVEAISNLVVSVSRRSPR